MVLLLSCHPSCQHSDRESACAPARSRETASAPALKAPATDNPANQRGHLRPDLAQHRHGGRPDHRETAETGQPRRRRRSQIQQCIRVRLTGAAGRGTRVLRTGLRCTSFHRFQAAAIFYLIFYPKRQRGEGEMLDLLITATNLSRRPEFVTSLPSWSFGSDSRRPLQPRSPGPRRPSQNHRGRRCAAVKTGRLEQSGAAKPYRWGSQVGSHQRPTKSCIGPPAAFAFRCATSYLATPSHDERHRESRSHREGQGSKSPQLQREIAGQRLT